MTKQSVIFMFSDIDSVKALATLIERMEPIWGQGAQEYGNYTDTEVAVIDNQAIEWAKLLRDFIRDHTTVEC